MRGLGELQSPLEAPVQELCNARLVEVVHMDESKPPTPPSESPLRSACERIPGDIDPAPASSSELAAVEPQCRSDGPMVAVYYRNEEEVRNGFLIALRAMGVADLEQHPEPVKPPDGGVKP